MDASLSLLILVNAIVFCAASPIPDGNENGPCLCYRDPNSKELIDSYEFFEKIPDFPILAGEITSDTPCGNCIEKRSRRSVEDNNTVDSTTMPPEKVKEGKKEEDEVNQLDEVPALRSGGDEKYPNYNKCPQGYVRYGNYCVHEESIYNMY